jgi:chloramphenicol-sensitive protein RarD
MSMSDPASPQQRSGFAYALAAFALWGLFPLYFKLLAHVPATEILAHRIVWSALLLTGVVTVTRRWGEWAAVFRAPKRLGVYALSTALISGNWLLYIWAVTNGRVLEASLGYFINPLVNVLLGVVLLRETLRPRQAAAIAVAAAGVLVLVLRLGHFPWVALALALSFGSYGLVRKRGAIDPIVGLLVETSLLAPIAAAFLALRTAEGTGHFGHGAATTALLIALGVLTAVPLIWFAHGLRSLRLSTVGLLQYTSPTLQLLCAVVLFREPFTRAHAAAFACIWASLALYTADAFAGLRAPAARAAPVLKPAD